MINFLTSTRYHGQRYVLLISPSIYLLSSKPQWPYLEANTTPPYTLSLKSNGCIIFIAALAPSTLLVTSKHSLGPVAGVPLSHAEVGEQWLEKHLTKVGKTKEALARILWDNNWTAIAEVSGDISDSTNLTRFISAL